MNGKLRAVVIGTIAGALASVLLSLTLGYPRLGIILGALLGAAYAVYMPPSSGAYVDNLMTAGALGIPLWGLISVMALPYLSGNRPAWSAEELRSRLPAFVGCVLYGAFLGLATQGLRDLAAYIWGPDAQPGASGGQADVKRIVILGGGFAGMKTAECLEQELRTISNASVTLISETNALLFTPMLAEVAGSTLEPSHISTPLRGGLRRTSFIRGQVSGIDPKQRKVTLSPGSSSAVEEIEIPYDHLVLALGSVSNYMGLTNIEKVAFNFKTLLDAIRIRNHVIEMFERADREPDASLRASLLTFVIAGGGFAGVELAGALNDFTRGILADYPSLNPDEINIILIHSRDRILPELSESLGRYAQRKMEARGVRFRLSARLKDAQPGLVIVSDGDIRASTLVWTAGTAPNPLLKSLAFDCDKRGAVVVDSTLAMPGHPGIWALGDCAAITDGKTGAPCPPTAQFAIREAAAVARNIVSQLRGRTAKKFHFDSLGSLCVIGHQTACAELSVPFARSRQVRFSGLLAWLMWRGIYLAKLPGIERKIRVLMDWTIELFFPRDIVQTIDLQ